MHFRYQTPRTTASHTWNDHRYITVNWVLRVIKLHYIHIKNIFILLWRYCSGFREKKLCLAVVLNHGINEFQFSKYELTNVIHGRHLQFDRIPSFFQTLFHLCKSCFYRGIMLTSLSLFTDLLLKMRFTENKEMQKIQKTIGDRVISHTA